MGFIINDSIKIADIQEAFTKMFPFLKLEFFRKVSYFGSSTQNVKQPIVSKDKTIAEVSFSANNNQILVSPQLTVNELENVIKDKFGLTLQIYRKSGNVWLLTSYTDYWTLEEQNHQGEIITQQVNNRKSKAS